MELLRAGALENQILILVPQRSLALPYQQIYKQKQIPLHGEIDILTLNGLSQRMLNLFWPLVAPKAGFEDPQSAPTFLTIETAQYYMLKIVADKMQHDGYFAQLRIEQNRLCSQLLDNLNKSALVGFDHREIAERLKSAWVGQSSHLRMYDQAQECINLFRDFCLQQQCLDYSLQMQTFLDYVWTEPLCREYLIDRYRHIIADNLEEDTPSTHRILSEWVPETDSSLLIMDENGGYRKFLGADPLSAADLLGTCEKKFRFDASHISPRAIQGLSYQVGKALKIPLNDNDGYAIEPLLLKEHLVFHSQRFFPQMLDWCADIVEKLIRENAVSPDQIAVISPFMPDTLRFALARRLEDRNIIFRTLRPSRSLKEEPLVQCLLTLAKLAHPHWQKPPQKQDVIFMFLHALGGIDLIRAKILADHVYIPGKMDTNFPPFARIPTLEQERITYVIGDRYNRLVEWINEYTKSPVKELDIFFRRVFGEILSTSGFGFDESYTAGEITANLVESARKFRNNISSMVADETNIGLEFVQSLENGLVAAQFQRNYGEENPDAVLLAPAHTFLMQNRAADIQIWLDIGSNGWWSRLEQPLTHPYVLGKDWPIGKKWTDTEEFNANQEALYRMVHGLLTRCRNQVYLAHIELNEQGSEQRGELLKALQTAILRINKQDLIITATGSENAA